MAIQTINNGESGSAVRNKLNNNFSELAASVNVPTDLSYTAATRLLASSTGADVNLPIFTGTEAGLVPASGGGTANFLRADGTFAAPGGGGGSANEVANWAALLALTGVPDGRVYTVMAPLITGGTPGTMWKRDSTSLSGWRPAGRQVIWSSTTIVSGTTGGSTTEEINRQWLVPGGVFRGCARVHFMVRGTYNAADAATRTVRMLQGTAGTTSDAVIASATNATNSRQHTYSFLGAPVSSTTIRHAAGNNFASPLSTEVILSGSTAAPADATVSSLDSDHYWTLTHQSGASPTATYSTEFVYLEVA